MHRQQGMRLRGWLLTAGSPSLQEEGRGRVPDIVGRLSCGVRLLVIVAVMR